MYAARLVPSGCVAKERMLLLERVRASLEAIVIVR
jgi:hypothetical protein